MCQAFYLRYEPGRLKRHFDLADDDRQVQSQDFAPGSPIATIEWNVLGKAVLQMASFGFRMRAGVLPMTNYRCESIDPAAPSRAFLEGRCIVPVDLFRSRVRASTGQQALYYGRADGGLLGLAAMLRPEASGLSVTILTVPAATTIRSANGRMPAVLSEEDYALWLDDTTPVAEVLAVTRHNQDDLIVERPIGGTPA